jgi:phage antirepressor YoqD-like protein
MKDLIQNSEKMMSSKLIAERTGKLHTHVLRDIRNMIDELDEPNVDSSDYQVVTRSLNGQTEAIFLNERLSLCLASGYSIKLRMMIIDDWAKIKSEKKLQPMTSEEMMAQGLIAANQLLNERNETIKVLQPKAAYADHILSSQSDMTTTTIAKELGMTAMQLNRKLKEKKIQFKQDNIWVLTARFQDKSLTSFRTYDYRDNWNNVQTSRSLVWTEKGRNFLHQIFNNQLTLA